MSQFGNGYVPPAAPNRPVASTSQGYVPPSVPPSIGYPVTAQQQQPPTTESYDYSRATSTDPGGSTSNFMTGEAVGTPIGSEPPDEDEQDSGAATPLQTEDEVAVVKKPSKALNFLKKKETKNIKGTTYKIIEDEIILEDDPRGETKIDDNGYLLGGRSWKVHTFTSPMRTNVDKLYMLSIDAARCAGFRDSLYFFRRNPLIHKLSCSQAEKDRLIELGKLSGNLKSRAVTMVSARNVFKVMGATFVQNGKYILDDYYEAKSLAAGHKPGEPAFIEPYDPEKDTGTLAVSKGNAPPGATSLGLNVLIGHPGKPKVPGSEFITSQIGGGLHATFGGNGLQPFGKSWDPSAKKAKPAHHLDVENWMFEYAKEVSEVNRRLAVVRRSHVGQVVISLGVEEKEEDCWEVVEEEYTDDEGVLPQAPQPSIGQPQNLAPFQPYNPNSTIPSSSSLAPNPNQQIGTSPAPASTFTLPSVSLPYAASPHPSTSQIPSPAPQPPQPSTSSTDYSLPSATPTVERPRKKRLTKRFNPIRGFYEPETNVPHVYRDTQPTFVETYREDVGTRIFEEGGGEGEAEKRTEEEEERKKKKRKLELMASKVGVASLEYVSYERAWNLEEKESREPLLPGMWDFEAGPGVIE